MFALDCRQLYAYLRPTILINIPKRQQFRQFSYLLIFFLGFQMRWYFQTTVFFSFLLRSNTSFFLVSVISAIAFVPDPVPILLLLFQIACVASRIETSFLALYATFFTVPSPFVLTQLLRLSVFTLHKNV